MTRLALQRFLARSGYTVVKTRGRYFDDGLFTAHSAAFRSDPAFRNAYARGIQASRGFDPQIEWRLHTALWAGSNCLKRPGDFVECGVNAGFVSSALMHYCDWNSTGRRYFLIDTFSGPVLEQFSERELQAGRAQVSQSALERGAYVTDVDRVRANFAQWKHAHVIQGTVPEILASIDFAAVSFVHLDMNCAGPEMEALRFFFPRLSPGGMILLDDYTYLGHEAQQTAIDAAAAELSTKVLSLPTGQGLILK